MPFRAWSMIALVSVAGSGFALGTFSARSEDAFVTAVYDAKLDAVRAELRGQLKAVRQADEGPRGTAGEHGAAVLGADATCSTLVAEVKRQLQAEMGLVPLQLVRDRRSSFVELNSEDEEGRTHYGTAGYLGDGYFITVKHAVVALDDAGGETLRETGRRIVTITVRHNGQDVQARLIDTGNAREEVHPGDWAIIRTRALDLPPLNPSIAFDYAFAEPIFRLGNDYSKGVIVSTGYVGQRMANGLVSALTDGHPGVSGGGVLDRRGDLVGIPVGRMQGDYRFSFILPLRAEMFRRVPAVRPSL